jgi:acetoacetyl-CoA synthetase
VETLAVALEEQHMANFSPLVCLKEGEGAPPFFIVHGIGGTVMELSRLGKLIDYPGAVYGLQARGLDGTDPPFDGIEDMAAYYVEAIRAMQPAGPYFISGYSFGGLVAVEMCRQLKLEGEEIGLLLLVDAYAHPRTWPLGTRLAVRWRRMQHRRTELAGLPWRETVSYAFHTATRMLRLRRGGQDSGSEAVTGWLRDHAPVLSPALRSVRVAGETALNAYVPRHYPGKIAFLRAGTPDPVFPTKPAPIWRPLVQEFALHTVKGSHFTIIGEHAASIAARISQCLSDARADRFVAATPQPAGATGSQGYSMEGVPC